MDAWDLTVGDTLLRRELHDRWGGGRFGGMEPAVRAQSVFLFTQPEVGSSFGYDYDGPQPDGSFHYTGDGQEGDQSSSKGGNKSLLDTLGNGRAVRLFRSVGTQTTYLGEFCLADPPYFLADAPDRTGELRSVLVFRLLPKGSVEPMFPSSDSTALSSPMEMAIEGVSAEEYARTHPEELPNAIRREAKLVVRYSQWLAAQGQQSVRQRIPIPSGGQLFTDLFNKKTGELVEAKASAARPYVRAGLGQILDYCRFVDHSGRALLLPIRPTEDLLALLAAYDVGAIWEEGAGFVRAS